MLSLDVAVRHAVLPIGAVVVLVAGVYLFVEVRAEPQIPPVEAPASPPISQVERASRPSPVVPHGAPVREPSPPVTEPPRSAVVTAAPPVAAAAPSLGAGAGSDGELAPSKLDGVMTEANRAYDHNDYDEAKQIAARVLAQFPTNVRMLRIMVSASCIDGDAAVAQANFAKLPPADQDQMKIRCARYGIAFTDGH
jgi:hypothetical protein